MQLYPRGSLRVDDQLKNRKIHQTYARMSNSSSGWQMPLNIYENIVNILAFRTVWSEHRRLISVPFHYDFTAQLGLHARCNGRVLCPLIRVCTKNIMLVRMSRKTFKISTAREGGDEKEKHVSCWGIDAVKNQINIQFCCKIVARCGKLSPSVDD